MKAMIFFILVAFCWPTFGQMDSISTYRLEFETPISFGLTNMKSWGHSELAGHLTKPDKVWFPYIQMFGFQLHYKERYFAHLSYSGFSMALNKEKSLADLSSQFPEFYLQQESKYQGAIDDGSNSFAFRQIKIGFGINIPLSKSDYIQPYLCYDIGTARFPSVRYAFKEYNSNNYFIQDYRMRRSITHGIALNVLYKHYWTVTGTEGKDSKRFYGFRIEAVRFIAKGKGTIERSDESTILSSDPITYRVGFQNISFGIFLGISGMGRN